MAEAPRLVLASASPARRAMLSAAGISFDAIVPQLDEIEARQEIIAATPHITADQIAEALARAKAETVSNKHPEALVIGSDQILACDGQMMTKAASPAEARATLLQLRGRRHHLISAVALAQGGETDWSTLDRAELDMRPFSEAFLDDYLARVGDAVLGSVGAYQLEGRGIQLFDRVSGDYFTILGLPLLSLVVELRRRGVLPS
jgi:septum formation protein